jgi:hypothetical protein
MDCLTTRATLDVLPPNSEGGPEGAQAAEHLAGCANCQTIVRARTEFDRQAREAFRAVAIPPGLKESLLAQLAAEPAVAEPKRVPRRRWGWIFSTVALVAVVVIGGSAAWYFNRPKQIEVARLVESLTDPNLEVSDRPVTEFNATPPRGLRLSGVYGVPARRMEIDGQVAGFWKATTTNARKKPMEVRVLVLPKSAGVFHAAPSSTGRWVGHFWVEGDLAYVLVIEGSDADLRRLFPNSPI